MAGIDNGAAGVEVIVTTYNNPVALHYTLLGLRGQTFQDFTVCIADDGSGPETQKVVDAWIAKFGAKRIRHVWHPDVGFAKNQILNKAIASSQAQYLVFLDGDCIASHDFLARHVSQREKGQFLSGGVLRMPLKVNALLNDALITSGEIFSYRWLKRNECIRGIGGYLKGGFLPLLLSNFLELISPVKKTWNGGNSSAWRADIVAVNGFNESLRYGAEDVELGVRLNNYGIKGRHIRYSAKLLHIEHDRGYVDMDIFAKNKMHIKRLKNSREWWVSSGLFKD